MVNELKTVLSKTNQKSSSVRSVVLSSISFQNSEGRKWKLSINLEIGNFSDWCFRTNQSIRKRRARAFFKLSIDSSPSTVVFVLDLFFVSYLVYRANNTLAEQKMRKCLRLQEKHTLRLNFFTPSWIRSNTKPCTAYLLESTQMTLGDKFRLKVLDSVFICGHKLKRFLQWIPT